jgi:hypothetical protein
MKRVSYEDITLGMFLEKNRLGLTSIDVSPASVIPPYEPVSFIITVLSLFQTDCKLIPCGENYIDSRFKGFSSVNNSFSACIF